MQALGEDALSEQKDAFLQRRKEQPKCCFNFRRYASASIAWADKFSQNSCSLHSTDSPSSLPSNPPPRRSKCSTTHFFLSRLHSHLIKSIETAAAMLHACSPRSPRHPRVKRDSAPWGLWPARRTRTDAAGSTGLASSLNQKQRVGGRGRNPSEALH